MRFALIGILVSAAHTWAQAPYRVDHLDDGILISSSQAGLDGWAFYPGTGDPGTKRISVVTVPGTTTKSIRGQSTNGSAISRRNDARYSFAPFAAGDTNAVSMIDIRYRVITAGNYLAIMGMAADGTDAGTLIDKANELGPTFGVQAGFLSGLPSNNFSVRGAGFSASHYSVITSTQADDGDWLRLRFTLNVAAGTGSLAYKNLSRNQVAYTPVTALQNINLQLDQLAPESAPTLWNAIYLRFSEVGSVPGYEVSNILPHREAEAPQFTRLFLDRAPANGPFFHLHFAGFTPGENWALESKLTDAGSDSWSPVLQFFVDNEYETLVIPTPAAPSPVFFRLIKSEPASLPE